MFIGHYAVGMAAKKWAPQTSLGTLFAAAVWLDLIWPIFVLMGLEHFNIAPGITKMSPFDFTDYPLSHSLVMAAAWGVFFGMVYLILERDWKGWWIVSALVLSHWVLDLVVHRPDLPLLPASPLGPKWGLGLWNYPWAAYSVEGALFIAGLWIYLKSTKSLDKIGSIGFWAFMALLVGFYISSFLMAVPTSATSVAMMAQSQFLLVGLGYWIDDHRKSV